MRRPFLALLLFALPLTLPAQNPNAPAAKSSAAPAAPSAIDLPVRKVVLYKNGVGYFEHAGAVSGNQRVTVDFTSAQLNDVLQSLTALDSKGGMIGAVGYNSTMPIAQQLTTLALGLKDYPATLEVYHAIRGQRVEVTGAGAPLTGRLVNVEFRKETDKNGATSEDHYFLIVATDTGALRTAEITDAVSVRMIDPSLQKQFASYLEIVASAQDQQLRHLTLEDRGQGERQLQVSYISEVPVWKSTYRIVFPRDPNGNATVQGWAVVDNTVGVDWNNVQLSLVAGAPQSFIQPLSQPLYTQRPTIPIATAAQNAPITHEAAEYDKLQMAGSLNIVPRASQSVTVNAAPRPSFGVAGMEGMGGSSNGVMGSMFGNGANIAGPASGSNYGGGVYRASDVMQAGDVSTNAFDDFFEYALTQPVTIHKNESAMVPILQQELPTTHITVWSDTHPTPLRAIWLENTSKLTLDSGSFSIFESGEFAGEGLLDPIHPGEKRLLSYAVDQAVKVRRGDFSQTRTLHRVAVHEGVLVETTSSVTDTIYTVTNAGDETRAVMVEHRRQPRAELVPSEYPTDAEKPVETTATAYRFRMAVEPHKSVDLHVKEHADIDERVQIGTQFGNGQYLITIGNYSPELAEKLKPAVDAQTALSDLNSKIDEITEKQKTLADDENRYRENLKALKDSTTAKRFVDELNQAEDAIEAARKEQTDLEKQRDQAQAHLDIVIAKLSFDTDLDVVLSKTP
jgi:FtsZ-binding cell division protein ZapB